MPINPAFFQRAQNLFPAPDLSTQPPIPQYQSEEDVTAPLPTPPINVNQRMQDLYHPQNSAANNLSATLSAQPQRTAFAPSGLSRVLATIAGAGARNPGEAFNTSRGIVNRPYDEATNDWENKVKPAEFLSSKEDARNKESFNIADKTIDNELAVRKESDIFKTKVADLERKITDSENKGREAEKRFNENQQNHQALIEVKNAQLEIEKHKAELTDLQHKNTLAETVRKHTADIEAEKEKSKNYQGRTELWGQYNKDRLAGKDVSTYIFDKDGQVTSKKVVSTTPAGDRVNVTDENGKTGTLPKSQVDDWLKLNNKRKVVK